MKTFLAALALLAVLPAVRAQNLALRDGQSIPASGVRRDGDTVLARIQTKDGTAGEVGYPVANIARIDFPEPAQLKIAGDLLNAGKADEASRQLTPILAYYTPFRDLPGNWWSPLALLQADALARLGRNAEVDALMGDIVRFGGANPDIIRSVEIKQAVAIERRGDHRNALAALEPLLKDPAASQDTLAEGWLAAGSARLALRNYKDALLAFLHVPVYTPDKAQLMPPALLGSAVCYVGLDDGQRAQTALKELIADYPASPEATEAKTRLQKLLARAGKPAVASVP